MTEQIKTNSFSENIKLAKHYLDNREYENLNNLVRLNIRDIELKIPKPRKGKPCIWHIPIGYYLY